MSLQENSREKSKWQHMAGLVAGPVALLAILLAPQPASVSPQAWAVVAVGLLRVIWWMTEAVPLATTALLSVLLFPMLDVMDTAVCISATRSRSVSGICRTSGLRIGARYPMMAVCQKSENTIQKSTLFTRHSLRRLRSRWEPFQAIVRLRPCRLLTRFGERVKRF